MKELSIEEKAERYDKAFGIARNVWRFSSNNAEIMRMEELFPELRESEDERIRKELIGFLRNIPNSNYTCEEMALWLEKQGQVKESEISQPIKGTSKENDNSLTKKTGVKRMKGCAKKLLIGLKRNVFLMHLKVKIQQEKVLSGSNHSKTEYSHNQNMNGV